MIMRFTLAAKKSAAAWRRPTARSAAAWLSSSPAAAAVSSPPPSRLRAGITRFHDRRDVDFTLFEVEGAAAADEDRQLAAQVLDSAEAFVRDWHHVDPFQDQNPPKLVPGDEAAGTKSRVITPPETKALLADFSARGFTELPSLGLPYPVQCGVNYMLFSAFSANVLGFHVLTRCAADLLEAHGSASLKDRYLADMRSGACFGTMALSEPHAGTSLAGITTLARPDDGAADTPSPCGVAGKVPPPDWMAGAWRIKGSKMCVRAQTPREKKEGSFTSLYARERTNDRILGSSLSLSLSPPTSDTSPHI